MSFLGERVAYLKGLAEGLNVEESTNEGKLIKGIIEVLEDFALEVDEVEDSVDVISEHIEEIDNDLAQLEYEYYDEDEESYEDEDYETDPELYEVDCPGCEKTILIEEEELANSLTCPYCGQEIDVEFEDEMDEENE